MKEAYSILRSGGIIVLRQIPEILWFRKRFVQSVAHRAGLSAAAEIEALMTDRCLDDNMLYRNDFLSMANFKPQLTQNSKSLESILGRAENLLCQAEFGTSAKPSLEDSYVTAHGFQLALGSNSEITKRQVADAYNKFPFSEDRYVKLAIAAAEEDLALTKELFEKVLANTSSYFWLVYVGDLAHRFSLDSLVLPAYDAALLLVNEASDECIDNPIDYSSALEGTAYPGTLYMVPSIFSTVLSQEISSHRSGNAPSRQDGFFKRVSPWASRF